MPKINPHLPAMQVPFIFPIIDAKLAAAEAQKCDEPVLNFGVGDIALPLAPSIADAICKAVEEMTEPDKRKGYGPSEGYSFLREAILKNLYPSFGFSIDDIFIADGINSDIVNLLKLFANDCTVGIIDPTYPIYMIANMIVGRQKIVMIPCKEEHGFIPQPPKEHCDLIFLCSPCNPTGVVMNRHHLKAWVDYALAHDAIIIFDTAYSSFVRSSDIPKTIYEIKGAEKVAIECSSFSKSAGFTGLRCGYTILPHTLSGQLNSSWKKRQVTEYNGVAYPIQRGAEAAFSPQGKLETVAQVDSYLQCAHILREGIKSYGFTVFGGNDSPYVWWKAPKGMKSWDFFDLLLKECRIIVIPGVGFGKLGEGYMRVSGFTTVDFAKLAIERIQRITS